jgi:hypothetical protein
VEYSCLIENKESIVLKYNIIGGLASGNGKNEMRISIPRENIDKARQVFLHMLEKVGNKHNVGKTVRCKLLCFIDFDYYELFEKQLMGLKYIKNPYGSMPVDFDPIVGEMEKDGQLRKVQDKFFFKIIKSGIFIAKLLHSNCFRPKSCAIEMTFFCDFPPKLQRKYPTFPIKIFFR